MTIRIGSGMTGPRMMRLGLSSLGFMSLVSKTEKTDKQGTFEQKITDFLNSFPFDNHSPYSGI
jgi:hypothetical protein